MTDPVETLARVLAGEGPNEWAHRLRFIDQYPNTERYRAEARALLAQITPALVVEQNKSLTDGIREAIRLAEQPHYGDTGTALDHYGEAVEVLRNLLKKQSG